MPEEQRRELAPVLLDWRRKADFGNEEFDFHRVLLCLHATATFSETSKFRWWAVGPEACQIMADRRPDWLQEWAERALDQTGSTYAIGDLVNGLLDLVDAGLIDPPQHDSYAIGVAHLLLEGWGADQKDAQLADLIRPRLAQVEHAIWRQFEVEGGGEISLANFDKYMAGKIDGKWSSVLKALADEGLLDRGRLLTASLEALNRGFKQYRANWFSQFHELLVPDIDERVERTGLYLDLLSSPVGPTVALAIAALAKIDKAGRLEGKVLVGSIEPALYAPAAKTSKTALRLLASAVKSHSELAPDVMCVAAAGLEHPKNDVQEAALKILESHADALDDTAREAIAQRLDVVSPMLRSQCEALCKDAAQTEGRPEAAVVEIDVDDDRIKAIVPEWRDLAGVDLALEFATGPAGALAPAPFTGMDIPRLDPDRRIEPIATFEGFVDAALLAAEHPCELDRVECVLSAAARFAGNRPENADQLLAPLKPAVKRFSEQRHWALEYVTPRFSLQDVFTAYLGEEPEERKVDVNNPGAVMVLRARDIVASVLSGRSAVMLSEPTHAGCWIDPREVVARSAQDELVPLGLADQCVALMRLSPEHRSEALAAAETLPGEWGAALRYALGGDEEIGSTLSLWVAAACSRAPFGKDEKLTGLVKHAEFASVPPTFSAEISWDMSRGETGWAYFKIKGSRPGAAAVDFGSEMLAIKNDDESGPANAQDSLTAVALSEPKFLCWLDPARTSPYNLYGSWARALWPQNVEPVFALSTKASCMLDGVVGFEPATEPLAEGLTAMFDTDVALGPMAYVMLARGFNTLDKPAAVATVDAMIATIEDGRFDADAFGEAMHQLLMGGIVVAKRWQPRLLDVARSSPLASFCIQHALQRALHPGEPQRPMRNMHAWLEVLLELSVDAGAAIDDELCREGLERHFNSGKAKTIARKLLGLKPNNPERHNAAAAAVALDGRIARAERWQRITPPSALSGRA